MLPFMVGSLEGGEDEDAAVESVKVYPQTSAPQAGASPSFSSPSASASSPSPWLLRTAELAAFALGTGGLVWFAGHNDLIRRASHNVSSLLPVSKTPHSSSFTQGFMLASVTAGIVAIASARYLSKKLDLDTDFQSLPSHISASPIYHAPHIKGSLQPGEYRKFKLTDKQELAKGIWRFVFALPTPTSVLGLPIGQHIGIRGPVGDETVFRSYTPVSNNRDLGRLELLIRIYPDGKLGAGYLSQLQIGDQVDIRGPKGAMRYRRGMSTKIGMVAGGTGITPVYQLIRAICEDPADETEISLVYANRSESDILLRKQLDRFSRESNGRFKVHYTLDQPPQGWQGGEGRITKEVLEERMPKADPSVKILLCGPPGLINATKNNLVELGYEAPGAVSKMTDQIFCF